MTQEDPPSLEELAARIPQHRPWRPRVATIAAGFLIGAATLGTIFALRARSERAPRPSLAPLGPLLSASLAPRVPSPREQLSQVDLSPCNALEGPAGPGAVDVQLTHDGRVVSAEFATLASLRHGAFDARYAGTARGACIQDIFSRTRVRTSSEHAERLTVEIALAPKAPRSPGDPFDPAAALRALDHVDLSPCNTPRGVRGIVVVTFLPNGSARVEDLIAPPTEVVPAKRDACVKDAFGRAVIAPFVGSELTTSYWFAARP